MNKIIWTAELATAAKALSEDPGSSADVKSRVSEFVFLRPGAELFVPQNDFIQALRGRFNNPWTDAQAAFEKAWGEAYDKAKGTP